MNGNPRGGYRCEQCRAHKRPLVQCMPSHFRGKTDKKIIIVLIKECDKSITPEAGVGSKAILTKWNKPGR